MTIFKQVHDVLSTYKARPHWAKKHYYKSDEIKIVSSLGKSKENGIELDSKGVFKNEFLENYLIKYLVFRLNRQHTLNCFQKTGCQLSCMYEVL